MTFLIDSEWFKFKPGNLTIRFSGICMCSERHYPPRKFGLNCGETVAFSLAKGTLETFATLKKKKVFQRGESEQKGFKNPFCFRRGKDVVKSAKRPARILEHQQQLVNSRNKMPLNPKFSAM